MTWHDVQIWVSGVFAGLAVCAFLIASAVAIRGRNRARRADVVALPRRPVARAGSRATRSHIRRA